MKKRPRRRSRSCRDLYLAKLAISLERTDHSYPVALWAALLERIWPDRYSSSPTTRPTDAPPGEAKIAVLRARAARGQDLFHPEDLDLVRTDRASVLILRKSNRRQASPIVSPLTQLGSDSQAA